MERERKKAEKEAEKERKKREREREKALKTTKSLSSKTPRRLIKGKSKGQQALAALTIRNEADEPAITIARSGRQINVPPRFLE